MIIYDEEKSLASLITDKVVSSICLPVSITTDKSKQFIDSLEKIKEHPDGQFDKVLAKMGNYDHPDLMYGSAILCSTIMNRNDDVFLTNETWAARRSTINTPFNDDHEEDDIIGHIIAARVKDRDGATVPDCDCEECVCDCPVDFFDIEVDFVVYKSIFPAIAAEIMELAPQGKKFVSMECKFSNFDYALIDANLGTTIIQRNESTAFLTKYLRAYGGDGRYSGARIGRVLRGFRFVGMGSVDVPANPTSEYTKLGEVGTKVQCSIQRVENQTVITYATKGTLMTIENLEQAQTAIADLTGQIDQLKAELAEAKKPATEVSEIRAEADGLKAQVVQLTSDLEAANTKITIAEQGLAQSQTKITELEATLATVQADLQTKTDALAQINAEAKLTERVNKMKELGVEVDDAKRTSLASMTDEAFASVVEFAQLVKKPAETNKTEEVVLDNTSTAAAAEEAANDALDVETPNDGGVENTAGDQESDTEKYQKTAAKLIDAVRASRTRKNNGQ